MIRTLKVLGPCALVFLAACSDSSSSTACFHTNLGVRLTLPTVTVVDANTGRPICDATIQIVSGELDAGGSGDPVQDPTDAARAPWQEVDTHAEPPYAKNELYPSEATCTYSAWPAGYTDWSMGPGTFVLLVTHPGYESVRVSNVLLFEQLLNGCDGPTPVPTSQQVSVKLSKLGT